MIDQKLIKKIQQWWEDPAGWCYAASEALYYLSGGKAAGITPMQAKITVKGKEVSHWWLKDEDGSIVDVTATQFSFPFPYEKGRGRGFQTRLKKETEELIEWLDKSESE
jgi:hypothetical protein